VSKRTGRYGERQPGEKTPAPPFGDRRGAPLPLLTQPMVAVEINRRELTDPAQTRLDNAVQRATEPSQTRLDNPVQRIIDTGPTRIDGMQPLKVEAAAIAHGKPTVMMAPQTKP
jgi:hypothetical protein